MINIFTSVESKVRFVKSCVKISLEGLFIGYKICSRSRSWIGNKIYQNCPFLRLHASLHANASILHAHASILHAPVGGPESLTRSCMILHACVLICTSMHCSCTPCKLSRVLASVHSLYTLVWPLFCLQICIFLLHFTSQSSGLFLINFSASKLPPSCSNHSK